MLIYEGMVSRLEGQGNHSLAVRPEESIFEVKAGFRIFDDDFQGLLGFQSDGSMGSAM